IVSRSPCLLRLCASMAELFAEPRGKPLRPLSLIFFPLYSEPSRALVLARRAVGEICPGDWLVLPIRGRGKWSRNPFADETFSNPFVMTRVARNPSVVS